MNLLPLFPDTDGGPPSPPFPPPVYVRELDSADSAHVEAVFESLSDQDRYFRFFRPMPTYPAAVMDLLTAMDGAGHVAVGIFVDGNCAGVARYICSTRRPGVAEVAVSVHAGFRGRGLAPQMLTALEDIAAERGVERFEILVHPSNRGASRLFRSLGFTLALEDGSLVGERPVGADRAEPGELALAA